MKIKIEIIKKTSSILEQYLLWQKKFRKNVTEKASLFKLAKEKITLSENKLKEKDFFYAEIILKSVEYLINKIK